MIRTPLKVLAATLAFLAPGFALAGPTPAIDLESVRTPIYETVDGAFVSRGSNRFGNRPLYGNSVYSVVLAGDRPLLRLGTGNHLNGALLLGYRRGDVSLWLHAFEGNEARYVEGRQEWVLSDPKFPGLRLSLTATALAEGAGVAVRLQGEGVGAGDELVWAAGGAVLETQSTLWKYDVTTFGRDALMTAAKAFTPATCAGNDVKLESPIWRVNPKPAPEPTVERKDGQEWGPKGISQQGHAGVCDLPAKLRLVDAQAWTELRTLLATPAGETPMVLGTAALPPGRGVHWLLRAGADTPAAELGTDSARLAFEAGVARAAAVAKQIELKTPDPRLNAAAAAAATSYRATFRDSMFTHSGMRWGVPLLGWRSLFGATAYGWHEAVLAQAKVCLARQKTEDAERTAAVADPAKLLASQAPDSRLYGKGRVEAYHPGHYDMQSQFFDQLVHAWRWTGSQELEKLLGPALELHLDYIRECFDPDGDGLYESYLNTWPTDGTWFNGGGTAEESAYAYRGHQAARDLALRAKDKDAVARHEQALARIAAGFAKRLWVASHGNVGAYVEQGGLQRLHESSWLYSTFCPIDSGMLTPEQARSALYYTEWALERVSMPYGGVQVWPSNWVPSIWSVRQMWPGDNYHLALAYYQAGLGEQAWDVLSGTFPHYMQYGPVPGDTGHPAGGTDFTDCSSMLCRVLVEGLFGFQPDRPAGLVRISPRLPMEWNDASIRTPDFSLVWHRSAGKLRCTLRLTTPERVELVLPLEAKAIDNVRVNGRPVTFTVRAGVGVTEVVLSLPAAPAHDVTVSFGPAARLADRTFELVRGMPATLQASDGTIVRWSDPQGVLDRPSVKGAALSGLVVGKEGHHLVSALVRLGAADVWQQFKVRITDEAAETQRAQRSLAAAPERATWASVSLDAQRNGDIRTIFQQEYLSPRPATVSLRIAKDGYSSWQSVLDPKKKLPVIELDRIDALANAEGWIVTPSKARFEKPAAGNNTAFVSLWDNWPDAVTIPVGKAGEALWFLVAGSTNPMQVRIANGEFVVRYEDGAEERLELVPPFNFWSLTAQKGFDYDYKRDRFSLPASPPPQVQLGKNCRAMVLNLRLRPGAVVKEVTFRAVSEEVILGLLAVSVQNPAAPR